MRQSFRFIVPLIALGVGVLAFVVLVETRPTPKKVDKHDPGTLVEVIEARAEAKKVRVPAAGTVIPAKQIVVAFEVSGRMNWMSHELLPGGIVEEGRPLARIDATDYVLAKKQQEAAVQRAQMDIELEDSRTEIARQEWEMFGEEPPEEEDSLAFRGPQRQAAKASLEAARSGRKQAQRAVAKTLLRAPFNAYVESKEVDVGQLVGPSVPVATLVGTDAFWVEVAIPVERLVWIDVPGLGGAEAGSRARVVQQVGDREVIREGEVIRLLGSLDPAGRMARVLVEIPDPLAIDETRQLPLLLRSYVEVSIEGKELNGVIEIPRQALREDDEVFVMNDDATLGIREVEVVWREKDTVIVSSGLAPGDRLIVSPIAAPAEGMKLRTADMVTEAAEAEPEPAEEGDAEPTDGEPKAAKADPK